VALYAQDAGVSAVFVHGRTREQGYRGRVDYGVIREVKERLRIPLIASGDTFSPQLVKRMFDETGCDGVIIARGALGNPWIFGEAAGYLNGGALPQRPSREEVVGTMIRHLDLSCDHYGEEAATVLFRKFVGWYVKGMPDTKSLKEKSFSAETKRQMLDIIEQVRTGSGREEPL
jgi:tRNA-dihydrouridine synthase B